MNPFFRGFHVFYDGHKFLSLCNTV